MLESVVRLMILAVYLEGLKGILQIRHKVLDSYKQNPNQGSQESVSSSSKVSEMFAFLMLLTIFAIALPSNLF